MGRRTTAVSASGWLSDNSAQVIWLGAHALDRRLDGEVWVNTSFTARQRRINERELAQLEKNRRDRGFQPERYETSYRAARALIEVGSGFRERLVVFPADSSAQSLDRAERATASFGGTVAAVELDWKPGTAGLIHGDIFTIKRRSTLPVAEYLERHSTAPERID
jgi:hypothetical protein